MSACTPERVGQNLHAHFKPTGNKSAKTKRKSFSFSFLSKSGSRKWRSNNLQLARENARLKKDLRNWMRVLTNNTIRYNNLEVAWRRRAETLSKVDIMSRMVGNQILKLVDSLAEMRSACQVELSIPLEEEATDRADRISRCRHSVPNVKMGRLNESYNVSRLPSKSQQVHHVNPMVSGHPIIKPTITLQRLNLQDVASNSPVTQIRSPLPELDQADEIEVMDLTTIVEHSMEPSSSSTDNSDEEEVVEVPVISRRMPTCSSPAYRDMVLPVAEVPLERLSLSRISDKHSKVANRNMFPGLIVQNDKRASINKSLCTPNRSATSTHRSMPSLPENTRVTEICNTRPINAAYSISKNTTELVDVTPVIRNVSQQPNENANNTLDVATSPIGSTAALSNRRSNKSSLRKYPPSSRGKTPTSSELRKSQMNGVSEKCRLVVALKDVSSYLHNGTLASTEQLEEGKVMTGASAYPESKDHNNESGNVELSILDTSVENNTQLNFTAGIGTLDYTAVPLNSNNVEGSSLSAKEEFLIRIQNEDPLEGPSWRYQSTPTGRKRTKTDPLHSVQLTEKGKYGSLMNDRSTVTSSTSPKKHSSDTYKHQSTENHNTDLQAENSAERVNFVPDEDMDITKCMLLCDKTNNSDMAGDCNMWKDRNCCLIHIPGLKSPDMELYSCEQDVSMSCRKKTRRNCINDTVDESESGEEWMPKKGAKTRSRSKILTKRAKSRCSSRNTPSRSRAVKEPKINRKLPVLPRGSRSTMKTPTQLECIGNLIEDENAGDTNGDHTRSKRRAAPRNLKEVSLRRKMRQ